MKNGLIIDEYGDKRYYMNDLLHREDGPAIEYPNGDKYWYLNGDLHREDGPSCEYSHGDKAWYLNGKQIHCKDNEEFLRIVKLIEFI
jgi:hypothetical protein